MKTVIIIVIAFVLLIPTAAFFLLSIDEPIENTLNEDIIITEPIQNTSNEDIIVGEIVSEKLGVVEGIVLFIGKPCPPSQSGPPCDGPYPNYEVIIYESDGKNTVRTIITDKEGKFETQLPDGDYLVFGKSLDFNKVVEIPIKFTIEPEKTISIEVKIDKGIR